MIKIITERDLIKKVPDRWYEQYAPFDSQFTVDKLSTYEKLKKLDTALCTANDVYSIIGNSSWTTMICDNCKEITSWIIRIGEEPDYDSHTVCLCKNCLKLVAKELSKIDL
jgi:hypothetical protein